MIAKVQESDISDTARTRRQIDASPNAALFIESDELRRELRIYPKKEADAARAAIGDESRKVQINAAIYPSEMTLFKLACEMEGGKASHLIREYLRSLCLKHRLIEKGS